MGATNMPLPRLADLQTRTVYDVAQVVRQRVPEFLIVAIAAQLPEIIVCVASVPVNGVVIVPTHFAAFSCG
jgi:hypothetical protein